LRPTAGGPLFFPRSNGPSSFPFWRHWHSMCPFFRRHRPHRPPPNRAGLHLSFPLIPVRFPGQIHVFFFKRSPSLPDPCGVMPPWYFPWPLRSPQHRQQRYSPAPPPPSRTPETDLDTFQFIDPPPPPAFSLVGKVISSSSPQKGGVGSVGCYPPFFFIDPWMDFFS